MPDPFLHGDNYPGPFVPGRLASTVETEPAATEGSNVSRLVGALITSPTIDREDLPNYNRDEIDRDGLDPSEYDIFTVPIAMAETRDERNGRVSQHISAIIFSGGDVFSVIELAKWYPDSNESPTMMIDLNTGRSTPQRAPAEEGEDGGWDDMVEVLVHYRQDGEAELVGLLRNPPRDTDPEVIRVDGPRTKRVDQEVRFNVKRKNYSHVVVTDMPSRRFTTVVARHRLQSREINPEPSVSMLDYPENALTEHPEVWQLGSKIIAGIYEIHGYDPAWRNRQFA